MFTNDELKEFFLKVHPEYLENSKNGGFKWKTARIFSAILYPDSIEKDINECCISLGVPCSLSPLHDSDLKDEETREFKKAHYHLLCFYNGKTTLYKFYSDLFSAFGDISLSSLDLVNSPGAYLRYFCRSNNPEKIVYNKNDIRYFNGFRSSKFF